MNKNHVSLQTIPNSVIHQLAKPLASTVTIRITREVPYHIWEVRIVEDLTVDRDKIFLDQGWQEIVNHYQISEGHLLNFWIRTSEIIDLQIRIIKCKQIKYDPSSHGETEPVVEVTKLSIA